MILITRPRTEAVLLAKELMKTHYSSFIEPMTSFRYYKKKITYKKDTTYIIASLQTVRVLNQNKPCSPKLIKHGNFLVIGKKVTQSLKQLGCSHIVKTFKDSDDLISYLNKTSSSNIKLEYLCGSIVNQTFLSALTRKEFQFKRNILYQSIARKKLTQKCIKLINDKQIKVVVIYSVLGAQTFIKLLKKNSTLNKLNQVYIVCLSKRIAAEISSISNQGHLKVAPLPNEESLLFYLKNSNFLFKK